MHAPCDKQASAVFIKWWLWTCTVELKLVKSLHLTQKVFMCLVLKSLYKTSALYRRLCCAAVAPQRFLSKSREEWRNWRHRRCFNVQNTQTHTNIPDCCWSGWCWFCIWLSSYVGIFGQTDCNTPSWPEGGDTTSKLNYIGLNNKLHVFLASSYSSGWLCICMAGAQKRLFNHVCWVLRLRSPSSSAFRTHKERNTYLSAKLEKLSVNADN